MSRVQHIMNWTSVLLFCHEMPCYICRCSVCLADYQAEDKLQRIPACGHAFHMDCIDHWLTTHTTCPLCRLSLLAPAKAPSELPDIQQETDQESSVTENADGTSDQQRSEACEEPQAVEHSESRNEDASTLQNSPKEQGRSSHSLDQSREVRDARNELKSMSKAEESQVICNSYHACVIEPFASTTILKFLFLFYFFRSTNFFIIKSVSFDL